MNTPQTTTGKTKGEKPTAVELAQIAASFGIDAEPLHAVRHAMVLLGQASRFLQQHSDLDLEEIARSCEPDGSAFAERAGKAIEAGLKNNALVFDPKKATDQVRRYFAQKMLPNLKSSRSVTDNLVQHLRLVNARSFLRNKGVNPKVDASAPQSAFDHAVEEHARNRGWAEPQSKTDWLDRYKVKRPEGSKGPGNYLIPVVVLEDFVTWKKRLKSTGGKAGLLKRTKSGAKTVAGK